MIASLVLFESEFLNIVSISFTALVLNELIMVAVEVTTWHTLMILSEVITLSLYVISILFLPEYFGSSPNPTSLRFKLTFAPPRPVVRAHDQVHLEGRPHRCHLGRAALGHQDPEGQVCADPVCKAQGLLKIGLIAMGSTIRVAPKTLSSTLSADRSPMMGSSLRKSWLEEASSTSSPSHRSRDSSEAICRGAEDDGRGRPKAIGALSRCWALSAAGLA